MAARRGPHVISLHDSAPPLLGRAPPQHSPAAGARDESPPTHIVHHPRGGPHPAVAALEDRIAARDRDIQELLVDNQRFAATHVALQQQLITAQHELRAVSIAEREAEVCAIAEQAARIETEARTVAAARAEVEQVHADVRVLAGARSELMDRLHVLREQLGRLQADSGKVETARAHIETMRREIQKGRAAVELRPAMAPPAPLPSFLFLLTTLLAAIPLSLASEPTAFDVRRHLSTVTRYDASRGPNSVVSAPSLSDDCRVVHLNLVARHGTRAPTKKRIKELDGLAVRLGALVDEANQGPESDSLKKIPSWIKGWESPWKGRTKGGELVSEGEEELYDLAIRVKERFQGLFDEEYHPDVYSIRATQVPRASASAVAFGLGLLSGKGKLGEGKNRAFSVLSESRASDICLRFFDSCQTYKDYRKRKEPDVDKQKEPILQQVTSSLVSRYHLNFTIQDVSSLWFLCKQEASLLNITDQACQLFNEDEVYFLEWTDDLEGFVLKGYGESINYRMGLPLLKDVVQSMEEAIIAKEENRPDGTYEKARLRFAHAETVVPFSCLLGLFLEGSDFEKIQREESLDLPPMPPQRRNWKGSAVAPFASNNMLVLYQCPSKTDGHRVSQGQNSSYFVQVLHNEAPLSMPGCGNKDFCPFEEFKEKIVEPHLKHDFNILCKTNKPDKREEPFSQFQAVHVFLRFVLSERIPC